MKNLCRQEWNLCLKMEYSQMELWIQEKIWMKKQNEADFYAKSVRYFGRYSRKSAKAENMKLSDPGMQNEDDIQPVADETGMTADGFMNVSGSIQQNISLKRSRPDTRRIREVPKLRAELKKKVRTDSDRGMK